MTSTTYGEKPVWGPSRPHIGPVRLLVSWVLSTVALLVAAWIVPGADVESFGGAFVAAAVIADPQRDPAAGHRGAAAAADARRSGSCSS